jgi:hypothetical protein
VAGVTPLSSQSLFPVLCSCHTECFFLPACLLYADLLGIKVVGNIRARRQKLYYILDNDRASNLKYTPVENMSAAAERESNGDGKKSEKGKKKKK